MSQDRDPIDFGPLTEGARKWAISGFPALLLCEPGSDQTTALYRQASRELSLLDLPERAQRLFLHAMAARIWLDDPSLLSPPKSMIDQASSDGFCRTNIRPHLARIKDDFPPLFATTIYAPDRTPVSVLSLSQDELADFIARKALHWEVICVIEALRRSGKPPLRRR